MKFLKQMLASVVGCIIAMGLFFILTLTIFGSILPSEPQVTVSPSSILEIDLSETIAEQNMENPFDLSSVAPAMIPASVNTLGILNVVRAIDAAAEDPDIKMILLNKCEFAHDLAYLEEIRNALKRFRTSGKPVISYTENVTLSGYYISSVADKIYVDEVASSTLYGISSSIFFLKDVLDKLGVEVQLIRHGKYKAAGEQFISNGISPANREQNEAMVNAMWKAVSTEICASRHIGTDRLNAYLDNLELNTAQDMIDAGLMDRIVSKAEMTQILCDLTGTEKAKDLHRIPIGKYAKVAVKNNYKAKDKIAIVYADGQINQMGEDGITAGKFLPVLNKIREDESVKAVVLRVNSPGGSVQPAEQIRKELEIIGKTRPIIVSYGTVAASGGYWISAGADKIYSNNSTLTGSIGVFSMIPSFEKTLKNIAHVNPVSIKTHPHADMLQLMRRLDDKEVAAMQAQIEVVYDKFLRIVSEGRDMTTEKVDEIAQGRVWCGNEALAVHLVDEIGGLKEALDYAAVAADLKEYKLVEYPSAKNALQKAMESIGGTAKAVGSMKDPQSTVDYLYRQLQSEKGIYARLPYLYRFGY